MYGIIDPRIIRRTHRGERCLKSVTEKDVYEDTMLARFLDHRVHEWTGEDRAGEPLAVVWYAGRRAGQLFSAFEITGRE